MPDTRYPFQMSGGMPVVPAPAAAPVTTPAQAGEDSLVAADRRICEQCGAVFVPQREHARFCGPGCRAAWNREHIGDPAVEASALTWSVTAMSEAAERLSRVKIWDRPPALAAIGEAVWWITMVDATLVRHHPGSYDAAMAARPPAERVLVEQILAGLRFVRNRIGRDGDLGELLGTDGVSAGSRRITDWRWKLVPEPPLAGLAPRGQAWEMTRYRAYQAQLAGHTIGQTLGPAAGFVWLAAPDSARITDGQESLAERHDVHPRAL